MRGLLGASLVALVLLVVAACGDLKGVAAPSCTWSSSTNVLQRCVSPDHLWAVQSLDGSRLLVLTRSTSPKTVARLGTVACCAVTWVKPHTLLFVAAPSLDLVAVNPPTQRRRVVGAVTHYRVSPDGRWIALLRLGLGGYAEVLSVDGATCRLVPLPSAYTKDVSFSSDSKSVVVTWESQGTNYRSVPRRKGVQTPIASLQRCSQST